MVVEEGQVLARLDDSDAKRRYEAIRANRNVARAGIEELEVNLADAERTLRRTQKLRDQGVASVQDLDSANAAVDALRAKLTVARTSLEAAKAQLAVSAQDLENYTIRAPFAGVITRKDSEIGKVTAPGEPLLTIEDQGSLKFRTRISEQDISDIKMGQEITVIIDALDDLSLTGTVSKIIPSGDLSTHEFTIEATLPAQAKLYPGMFGKAEF